MGANERVPRPTPPRQAWNLPARIRRSIRRIRRSKTPVVNNQMALEHDYVLASSRRNAVMGGPYGGTFSIEEHVELQSITFIFFSRNAAAQLAH